MLRGEMVPRWRFVGGKDRGKWDRAQAMVFVKN